MHMPKRDLVLAASDSLTLSVSIVESDDPSAEALYLTGGIGGPALHMSIWAMDRRRDFPGWWDYGLGPWSAPRDAFLLACIEGTISTTEAGTFDLFIPAGSMIGWPPRCEYSMHLCWGGDESDVLASGTLQVRFAHYRRRSVIPILLDDGVTPLVCDTGPPLDGG